MTALRLTFKTTAAAQHADAGTPEAKEAAPTKKKQLFTQDKAETKQVSINEDGSSGATFTIGTSLDRGQEEAFVRFCARTRRYSRGSPISW